MKLKELVNIIKMLDSRATPCDIAVFLESKHFSESKQAYIKYGQLDLFHVLRIFLKYSRDNIEAGTNQYTEISALKSKLLKVRKALN